MYIRLYSDLHLEFYRYFDIDDIIPICTEDHDTILILAGDIHVGVGLTPILRRLSKRFKHVISVFGNHEFYNNKFPSLISEIIDNNLPPNVHILENEYVDISNIRFIGCTLWTNVNNNNPIDSNNIRTSLNDYILIKNINEEKLTPYDTYNAHLDSLEFLSRNLTESSVVVTHHAPLIGVSNPVYKKSKIWSGFESDLSLEILKHQPRLWIYGHTHYNCPNIEMGKTTIMTNQKGYPNELVKNFDINGKQFKLL